MAVNRITASRFVLTVPGYTSNEYFNQSLHSQLSHQNQKTKKSIEKSKNKKSKSREVESTFPNGFDTVQRWIRIKILPGIACIRGTPIIRISRTEIPISSPRSAWFVIAIWNFWTLEHSKSTWKNRIPKRVHSQFQKPEQNNLHSNFAIKCW